MLFLPPGSSRLLRAQGAFTTDEEIQRIVSFIAKQAEPEYEQEIHEKLEKKSSSVGVEDDEEDPELLERAVEIIRQTKRASTSSLQRRLRIGYTRAARVMDVLEERGIIGPPRGSEPREILIDLDGEIPDNPVAETDESED
jgi:S-DNA-T family DNA segregation ATPase FtsK/SpoIIIE